MPGALMTLQAFVAESLSQIVQGIRQAHEAGVRSSGHSAEAVEFDVAVTVTDASDKKGGIGIFVGGFGIGGQANSSAANTSVSRIKFKVPVFFPDKV
jgi:hypothetical protein